MGVQMLYVTPFLNSIMALEEQDFRAASKAGESSDAPLEDTTVHVFVRDCAATRVYNRKLSTRRSVVVINAILNIFEPLSLEDVWFFV